MKNTFINQELEESKLIDNIKREGIYGTKGIVDQNNNLLAYSIKTHDLLIRTKKIKKNWF